MRGHLLVRSVLTALLVALIPAHAQAQPSGSPACRKNVVVTGYWPPTNEMLRAFSTDPVQNSGGWQGENWHGHGFDVHAYFPEFPPDGNPFNDSPGSDGYIGSPSSDFRVDYQDTSADFWRIMDERRPVILITTSRGGGIGWEIEAREGGHGAASGTPEFDWLSDGNGPELRPSAASIDPRSWTAISTYRAGVYLDSTLPMSEIVSATNGLGLVSVAIDNGTSGNYLSGFMGLHGVYYNHISGHNVAAGHIHVGTSVSNADARTLIEATLDAVLGHFNADDLECSELPPVPIMRISETVLNYGEVELGFAYSKAIVIHNDGGEPLEVAVSLDDAADPDLPQWAETNEISTVTIPPGSPPLILRQTYEPQVEASHDLLFRVTSNDATAPSASILLTGAGVAGVPIDTVLVLDRSGSMQDPAGERIKVEAMGDAAMLYTDLLRDDDGSGNGDRLGFWKYNGDDERYMDFDVMTAARKNAIAFDQLSAAALTDPGRLRPQGRTGIGGAMRNAAAEIGGATAGRKQVLVVLTDGIENEPPYITEVLDEITGINADLQMYSVGLGSSIEPAKLQAITNMGVGGYHQVADALTGESLYELETFYFKIFANAAGMDLVVDPTHVVDLSSPGPKIIDRARVISSDRTASFLVLDDPALRGFYDLEFISPSGEVIAVGSSVGGVPVHVAQRNTYTVYRIVFPDRSKAASYVGDWLLRLTPNGKWDAKSAKRALAESRTTYSAYVDPHKGLVPIGFAAAVASNYSLDVAASANQYLPGARVRLEASLTDRKWPAPRGEVRVSVRTPSGGTHVVTLHDDGTHGDVQAGDATWTNEYVQTHEPGTYRLLFRSMGFNNRGEMAPREATRYVTLKRLERTPDSAGACLAWWCRYGRVLVGLFFLLLAALLYCCFRKRLHTA